MRNGGNLAVALTMLVIFSMGSVSAQSQIPFGADVFIGGIPGSGEPTDGETVAEFPRMGGWEVGASLRHGQSLQWLGWTGAYARHSNDQVRVRELLGGVRATSPWLFAADGMTRAFGHALTGYAWSRSTVADRSPVLVLGGGFDVFLFRLQGDYVQTHLSSVPRHSGRAFVGAVIPICFSGCGAEWKHGIPIFRLSRSSVPSNTEAP